MDGSTEKARALESLVSEWDLDIDTDWHVLTHISIEFTVRCIPEERELRMFAQAVAPMLLDGVVVRVSARTEAPQMRAQFEVRRQSVKNPQRGGK